MVPSVITAWADHGEPVPMVVMTRLRFLNFRADGQDGQEFKIGGKYVPARTAQNVSVPAGPCVDAWFDVPVPACPDCGGNVVWAEAGYVPGARQCSACGSVFMMNIVSNDQGDA